jgi:hypothetical protein
MYLKVHPSGEEHLWFMYRVPDEIGMTKTVRSIAEDYERETGHRAEAVSNYDTRHHRFIAEHAKKHRHLTTRGAIIDDPAVFVSLFLG